jgi:preprotein translocase subunit SecF
MELLRNTNIDFMKYRKYWVVVSLIVVAVGVFAVFVHGKLNIGIDFAGGTQINLKFRERPDVDRLRTVLAAAGLGEVQIQRFGAEEENEVILKTPIVEGSEEGSREQVVQALGREFSPPTSGRPAGRPDVNAIGADALAALLAARDPDGVGPGAVESHYLSVAEAILEQRREDGIFTSWDQISAVAGVSPRAAAVLREALVMGEFAVVGTETVGPQIGEELRRKGFMAVALSLLGMMVYIWFRFELRFGIGALMAVLHDVLVTLGLYALSGFEFNLTTIAAFLTLVGYSVNDSVVIFDRIRENMRKSRREPLITIMNRSLNETLSRTILTGGSTLLALGALLIFGGDVIRGFSFVMFIGILIGTYSSIYIASPFALLWEQLFGKGSRAQRAGAAAKTKAV